MANAMSPSVSDGLGKVAESIGVLMEAVALIPGVWPVFLPLQIVNVSPQVGVYVKIALQAVKITIVVRVCSLIAVHAGFDDVSRLLRDKLTVTKVFLNLWTL